MNNKGLLGVFATILGITSLLQGIFPFTHQALFQVITSLFLLAAFAVFAIKKESLQFSSPIDFVLPLFVLVYLIGAFFAVSAKLAAAETLNYISYFLLFVLVSHLSKEEANIKILLKTLFWIIVLSGVIGLGSAMGLNPYEEGYSQGSHLIKGLLTNHHAYGLLCFFGILLGYGLYQITEENWKRLLYALGGFLLLLGGMNASADSAMLLFPIGLIAFVLLSWRNWTKTTAYSLTLLLPYLLVAKNFGNGMMEGRILSMVLQILLGFLVTVILVFFSEIIRKIQNDVRVRIGYACIAVGIAAIMAFAFFPTKLLPENVTSSLSAESIAETMMERAVFYQDSYTFIQTNPVIGGGGDAWNVVNKTYQSKLDAPQLVQSYFMQIWMEAGLIGLVLYFAIILLFLYGAYKAVKKCNIFGTTIASSCFYLLLHSFFENGFQDHYVAVLFWSCFAMLSAMSDVPQWKLKSNVYPFIALALVALIASSMYLVGQNYQIAGGEAISREDYKSASKVFYKAVRWNPLDDESRLSLMYAKLYMLSKGETQEAGFVDEFNNTLQAVLKRGQRNVPIVSAGQVLYDLTSQTQESMATAERLVELQPLSPDSYETLVRAYVNRSNELLKQGDKDGAKAILHQILNIPDRITQLTAGKEKVSPSVNTLITIQRAKEALKELE